PPLLSDDLYRYLFEGEALWAGHNPLVSAPATLPGLDDPLLAKVNHPEVSTVYPPVALLWFRFLALAGTPHAVQLASALVDALTPLALLIATRRYWPAWVYALHPLPVLEGAQSGHLDVLAVGLAAWGVAASRRDRPIVAGTLLLAGGGVKLLPFALLPRVLQGLRRVWPLVAWAVVGLAISGPFLAAGVDGLAGIQRYAREWTFNPVVYALVEPWLGSWTRPLLVGLGGLVALRALRHRDPGRTWLEVGTGFVLLSPTVHPWYLLWALVPGLLCESGRWAAASVAYLPAYLVLLTFDPATGAWSEAPWMPVVTWFPAFVAYLVTHSRSEYPATIAYPPANSSKNGSDR
ncbi:MAG: glycosyltransferase family 87 protein, partial [Myxococcota bacterium]